MAAPIPQYGASGGAYWPAKSCIPVPNPDTYYVLTDDGAGAFLLEAASNPGVDPLDLDYYPQIRVNTFIYFPATGEMCQVKERRGWIDTVLQVTATLRFLVNPTTLAVGVPEPFLVIDQGINPIEVENIGGVQGLLNGQPFISGQKTLVTEPVTYDASGTQYSFSVRW